MRRLLLFLMVLLPMAVFGQLLPPNQPEQDACHALVLCGNSFYTPYSYQGHGLHYDLSNSPCSIPMLNADEANSMWLRLEITSPGTIIFDITPVNRHDDYDWAVLDITNGDCHNLSSQEVVRCNFDRNVPVTNNGVTGLNMTATEHHVLANTTGHNYCQYINAQAGDVYLIMVNNFGYNGGPSSGFTIDFSGSTATFNNTGPPHLDRIINPCEVSKSLIVKTTKPVKCSSIAGNGSDFSITGGGGIAGEVGINCNGNQGYTSEIKITFLSPLPPGNYVLHAQTGTDGNTLLDLCDNELPLPDDLPFTVPVLSTTETKTICNHQLPYHWHGHTINSGGNNVAQATFTTAMGCDSTVSLNLIVQDTLKETKHLTICPEQLPFTWNGITVNSGGRHIAQYFSQSFSGCDSLTYLNLTVQYPVSKTYLLHGCWTANFNGKTYYHSQTAYDTIISSFGCDSVYAKLYVVVYPPDTITTTLDTSGCGKVVYKGKEYHQTTTLRDTIRNHHGCDSIYEVTHIKVYPNHYEKDYYIEKSCDSVVFEGSTYHHGFILVDTFQNFLGCDSAIRVVRIQPEHFKIWLTAHPPHPVEGVQLHLKTHANKPHYHILSWQPANLFPLQTAYEQSFKVTNHGDYIYTVKGQSELGCIDTGQLKVHVDTLYPHIHMPNAFSPNGDGLNDVFRPNLVNRSGYTITAFKIYNRYGQLVYQGGGQNNRGGWDGTYGNGEPADDGVYYYFIKIRFVDGTERFVKGDVTLIR